MTLTINPNVSVESKARYLMLHRTQQIKKRQQSLFNRAAAQIGINRPRYCSRIQGQIQSTFRFNYDRQFSHSS